MVIMMMMVVVVMMTMIMRMRSDMFRLETGVTCS
jgi:hypothetical protein